MGRWARALAGALTLAAGPAAAEWEYHYYGAETGEDLAVCTAGIYYEDGPFVLRVYDRIVDFYLADDELSLPPDRPLGSVVFAFRDADFVLRADSGWDGGDLPVNYLYLTPEDRDVAPLLTLLRDARDMEIVFPDGLAYTIGLTGSSVALAEAFECWSRETTGPLTGRAGINPFEAPAARNRFD